MRRSKEVPSSAADAYEQSMREFLLICSIVALAFFGLLVGCMAVSS